MQIMINGCKDCKRCCTGKPGQHIAAEGRPQITKTGRCKNLSRTGCMLRHKKPPECSLYPVIITENGIFFDSNCPHVDQAIKQIKNIIERQSAVLNQVRERKEDARHEFELNESIESEMVQEEWMMRRAIVLLKDAYENKYYDYPNLEGNNREEAVFTNNEE